MADTPPDVERYLMAQFFYTVITQVATRVLGTRSPYYAAIYSVFTLLIIGTMMAMVSDKLKRWILSWMFGVLIAWTCYVALPKPLHYYNWISLGEGMALATCGSILIFNARKGVYLALSILWLLLAGFRLCYALEMQNAVWRTLNWYIPSGLCTVTFAAIGFLFRKRNKCSFEHTRVLQ
jgi:hypothetical protein